MGRRYTRPRAGATRCTSTCSEALHFLRPLVAEPRTDAPPFGMLHRVANLEHNKRLVRRLVDEVVNLRDDRVLDRVAQAAVAEAARRWISPFRAAFPDFRMEIASLVAEGDKVVAHFRCSGTHLGEWLGIPPTGRRFEDVDEIYVFGIRDGLLTTAVGVEDNLSRIDQLGLRVTAPAAPAARTPETAPDTGSGASR